MIPCKVTDICRAVGGTLVQSGADAITGVTTDSRNVTAGDLFVPLVGERFDGHTYLNSALEKGAEGCLCAKLPETLVEGKFYIQVEDTLTALRDLAGLYRGQFAIPVIQVTGSAGKTTTKEMLWAVLSRHGDTLKTLANYNNQIGTPQTLLRLEKEHWAAVVETGMDHFGDLSWLAPMVRPTVAVITNIGDAHIENMGGTRLGTLRSKSEIFEGLAADGLAVLNGDDELLNTLQLPFNVVRCGKSEGCDVRVTEIVDRGIDGIDCTVTTKNDTYRLAIPSPGGYMIYPASMAVAIGEHLGLSHGEIVAGVADYVSTGSRMRRIRLREERLVVDDCYNANPQAMREALQILANSAAAKKLAVLGDMGELGELTAEAHRAVGKLTGELGLDAVVAIGPKSADIAATASGEVYHFLTIEEAMPTVHRLFTAGTAVLVKASHAMEFPKIVKELEETYP
ncbi:MAG: UDP-N-acetylmuramoyl-tripeptide--D-alanyl-D-alanine ligase [Oscillospiraceae bacterium]|nr:UDP-N-acetylmuramoyl-tripeptide--D-alanyl-D-alanine ligase [Oscillospiraceae bacterium]